MATPFFCCGAECGQSGTVGQHFNFGSATSFVTTGHRTGARAIRSNPTTTGGYAERTTGWGTRVVGRAYMKVVSAPSVTALVSLGHTTASGVEVGLSYKTSDSKWYARIGASIESTTGVAITTSTWTCIDWDIDVSTNPWSLTMRVGGTGGTTLTASNPVAASTISNTFCGSGQSHASDLYFDDFLYSKTGADYPLGPGYVNHFVPTSDGTHSVTTYNIVKGTIAAPTAGGNVDGATDVFNWLNGVPLLGGASDNTRLVNQQVAASAQYAELVLGPAPGVSTPTVAPRAVEAIAADRQASTNDGIMEIKLNDNGTVDTFLARAGTAGVTTDRYRSKQYALAPTGGAWTVVAGAGNFNNLRARGLFSNDANPDQYWRGIMVEAEFVEVATNVVVTPPTLALTLTRFIPAVNLVVIPSGIALTLTTFVPVIGYGETITPPVRTLILTMFVPTISATGNVVIVPPLLALTLATFVPPLALSITPPTLALTTATFAPVIKLVVVPSLLALTLTPFEPTIIGGSATVITPPTLAIILTQFVPVVITPQTIVPPTLALTLAYFAPPIVFGQIITPPVLALTLGVFAPVIAHGIIPPVLALVLTPLAPVNKLSVVPPVSTLTITTFAPTISTPVVVTPGILALVITTFEPDLGGPMGSSTGPDYPYTHRFHSHRVKQLGLV